MARTKSRSLLASVADYSHTTEKTSDISADRKTAETKSMNASAFMTNKIFAFNYFPWLFYDHKIYFNFISLYRISSSNGFSSIYVYSLFSNMYSLVVGHVVHGTSIRPIVVHNQASIKTTITTTTRKTSWKTLKKISFFINFVMVISLSIYICFWTVNGAAHGVAYTPYRRVYATRMQFQMIYRSPLKRSH